MNRNNPSPMLDLDFDRYIAAYEAAVADGPVAVESFLPPIDHPHFGAIAVELLRVDMEFAWERGQPCVVADYEARFRWLAEHPTARAELAFEEQRQRQAHADLPATQATAVVSDWDGHEFPLLGHTVAPGFQLLNELGRGAFGRVFLAEEVGLAKRRVALKVSSKLLHEAQTLARLQHTNIVPIYAVHHVGRFQLIVMPFLGSNTLADVLHVLRANDTMPMRAETLVSALASKTVSTASDHGEPTPTATPTPVVPLWANTSYTEAVLLLATELADGLHHAHERDILHGDLKPANILLTDDGHPMLLDFNLAADQQAGDVPLGGTPRYMAPEQLAALLNDQPHRSAATDIYSLGLILYELFIGRLPFGDHRGPWQTTVKNALAERTAMLPIAHDSPAIVAILQRCLAPNPANRYSSAKHLAEDCRRQIESQPLRHARERWSRERVRKWLRRHPRLTSATSVALLATVLLLVMGGLAWSIRHQARTLQAKEALAQVQETRAFVQPWALDPHAPTAQYRHARERIALALAPYGGGHSTDYGRTSKVRYLSADQQHALTEALAELLYADAQATAFIAANDQATAAEKLSEALATNEEALRLNSSLQRPLLAQRVRLFEARQDSVRAAELLEQLATTPDHANEATFLQAVEALATKRFAEAQRMLRTIIPKSEPSYSVWMALGLAYLHGHEYVLAADAFLAATTLEPQSPWAYLHRGLALLEAKQWDRAIECFTRFNTLKPEETLGLLNLALASWHRGEYQASLQALDRAETLGQRSPRLYSLRSQCYRSLQQPVKARQAFDAALNAIPTDADGWTIQGELHLATQPANDKAAEQAFAQALTLHANYLPALRGQASVMAERRQPRESLALLARLLKLNSHAIEDRAGYAVMLARHGDAKQAQAEARSVLKTATVALPMYQAASALAIVAHTADERREVLAALREVLKREAQWASTMLHDPDLTSVAREPAFQELLAAARVLNSPPKP